MTLGSKHGLRCHRRIFAALALVGCLLAVACPRPGLDDSQGGSQPGLDQSGAVGIPPAGDQTPAREAGTVATPHPGPQATAAEAPKGCDPKNMTPWVASMRQRALAFSELARFAVATFGDPIACSGERTARFDGNEFGTLLLEFEGGASYRVEQYPPESGVTTLVAPAGFPDDRAAEMAFRGYVDGMGAEVAWSRATTITDGDESTERFESADPGMNGSAELTRIRGTLVRLRFSLAL